MIHRDSPGSIGFQGNTEEETVVTKAQKEKKEKEKKEKGEGVLEWIEKPPGTSIGFKLCKVLAEIHSIPKEGFNAHFQYKYVTEDTLTERIRPLLAKHGLCLVFGSKILPSPGPNRTQVACTFHLLDVDGNELITEVVGEGKDGNHQDKALYKAYTGATKYFLYKTFLVTTGDDPEVDGRETIDQAPDEMDQGQRDELSMYRKMEDKSPGLFSEQLAKLIVRTLDEAEKDGTRTASKGTAKRLIDEAGKQLKESQAKGKKEEEPPVELADPGEEPPAEQHPRDVPL
jgi:hypothetical protein